jgi:hypothetical protein
MGLIKTAIMTGGAVYAVNKIAKSHQSQQAPAPQGYYPQSSRGNFDQYPEPQGDRQFFSPPQNGGQSGDLAGMAAGLAPLAMQVMGGKKGKKGLDLKEFGL